MAAGRKELRLLIRLRPKGWAGGGPGGDVCGAWIAAEVRTPRGPEADSHSTHAARCRVGRLTNPTTWRPVDSDAGGWLVGQVLNSQSGFGR